MNDEDLFQRFFSNPFRTPTPNRSRQNRREPTPPTMNSSIEDCLLTLQEIYREYNENIHEYNENIRRFTHIIQDIIDNRNNSNRQPQSQTQQQTQPNVSRFPPIQRNINNQISSLLQNTPLPLPQQNNNTNNRQRRNNNNTNTNNIRDLLYYIITVDDPNVTYTTTTFQDVIVAPTAQEIENATEVYTYSLDASNQYTSCPITQDNFQEGDRVKRILYCGHVFKEPYINNWFSQNVRCPVCRYDIRNYNRTTTTTTRQEESKEGYDDDDDDPPLFPETNV